MDPEGGRAAAVIDSRGAHSGRDRDQTEAVCWSSVRSGSPLSPIVQAGQGEEIDRRLPPACRDRAEGEEVKTVNTVRIVAALLAALCWFMSARTKLTRVRAGLQELDKVT
jgi:hypothetical protein